MRRGSFGRSQPNWISWLIVGLIWAGFVLTGEHLSAVLAISGSLGGWSSPLGAAELPPESGRPVPDEQAQRFAEADRLADQALAEPSAQPPTQPKPESNQEEAASFNFLETMLKGGPLMIPIGLLSLVALTFIVERALALRRHKVIPPALITGLGKLASQPGGLDPRAAYRLAQRYPSAAANVIRAMLLKVGRPLAELEHTVAQANDREAARLYANVRWLNLTAGVAPLLGLLGTVQGMIMAFFVTANLPTGANKAQALAEGIYTALVTTFAGLCVAIPAAIAAHLFETHIEKLFRELDQILQGVLPQLERYEGRLRITPEELERLSVEPPPAPAGRK
ncbi:MAG: MotA/TolQ/ExbB proton channel family protein [Thermoguttaceae bacterium]|nr:MotA/TolQ/ExbB proton channel family protein [Thermoguttaceae bacterium]MDW8038258.1 MotA/TolQ/ExbB proton channel family protein [Thermoguttaceae bacterium]